MNAKPLLDLIARHESDSAAKSQNVATGYDVVVQQAFRVYPPQKPISSMTIGEVLAWQVEAIKRYQKKFLSKNGYSAVGRYQIVLSTLRSLIHSNRNVSDLLDATWRESDIFDEKTQDTLAMQLLRRRGWLSWIANSISNDAFADELSKEWASLPYHNGKSYYAGDAHGNAALVSRLEVMTVLRSIKD